MFATARSRFSVAVEVIDRDLRTRPRVPADTKLHPVAGRMVTPVPDAGPILPSPSGRGRPGVAASGIPRRRTCRCRCSEATIPLKAGFEATRPVRPVVPGEVGGGGGTAADGRVQGRLQGPVRSQHHAHGPSPRRWRHDPSGRRRLKSAAACATRLYPATYDRPGRRPLPVLRITETLFANAVRRHHVEGPVPSRSAAVIATGSWAAASKWAYGWNVRRVADQPGDAVPVRGSGRSRRPAGRLQVPDHDRFDPASTRYRSPPD